MALMLAVPVATAWRLSDPFEPASPLFEPVHAAAILPEDGASSPMTLSGSPASSPDRTTIGHGTAPTADRARVDPSAWMPWIVALWGLGVLFCCVRLAGGWWQARRLTFVGTRPAPAEWQRTTAMLSSRLGLIKAVRLLESTRVAVPIVVGWLKPTLLVPTAALGGLSPMELEAVLAHELAHIRRHDYLVNLLQAAVETLLFYHPGVWWVSHVVRTEREHCCDDLAVAACGDAVLYARALTAIETLRHDSPGMAMAVSGSPLLARVRRLLGVREPARVSSSGWIVGMLTALMVSGAGATGWVRLPMLSTTDVAASASQVAASANQSAPTPQQPSAAPPAATAAVEGSVT